MVAQGEAKRKPWVRLEKGRACEAGERRFCQSPRERDARVFRPLSGLRSFWTLPRADALGHTLAARAAGLDLLVGPVSSHAIG